jgi:mono-ADP-ribosyltransferase sirtuin 6
VGESSFSDDTKTKLDTLAAWIKDATTVVWFTGAGISTDSGLPDFRGPDGVWTRRDQGLPPPVLTKRISDIRPNPGHLAIVEFEKIGKCSFLISQNVDNLHLRSGYPFDKLAELHGNKDRLRCRECQRTHAIVDLVAMPRRKKARRNPTHSYECPNCGGVLGPSVVNFGDPVPLSDFIDSFCWAEKADLFIVVGSSCQVTPAADLPMTAKEHGSKVVIMNIGETGADPIADLRFDRDKISPLLTDLRRRVA